MTLTNEMKKHYQIILKSHITNLAKHEHEFLKHKTVIQELKLVIINLSKTLKINPPIGSLPYENMSIRQAILYFLNETNQPLSAPDIAKALIQGGIHTKALNFANNISAVISNMKRHRKEVDIEDGKWFITNIGREKIA